MASLSHLLMQSASSLGLLRVWFILAQRREHRFVREPAFDSDVVFLFYFFYLLPDCTRYLFCERQRQNVRKEFLPGLHRDVQKPVDDAQMRLIDEKFLGPLVKVEWLFHIISL